MLGDKYMKEQFKVMVQNFIGESEDVSDNWEYDESSYEACKEIVKFVLQDLQETQPGHCKCVYIRKVFKLKA